MQEASFEGISDFELERDSLFDVVTECRVVRSMLSRDKSKPYSLQAYHRHLFRIVHHVTPEPSRVQFKTPEELAVMQYANDIASAAHVELLRYAKPGMVEYQLVRPLGTTATQRCSC